MTATITSEALGAIRETVMAHGNVIRVLMPLVITEDQLEKGLGIMEEGPAALES